MNHEIKNLYFKQKLLVTFIISIVCIEVNFGKVGFNIGNLILLCGSLVVIAGSFKIRTLGFVFSTFIVSDFFFAFLLGLSYLLSVIWSVSPTDTLFQYFVYITTLFSCYMLRDLNVNYIIRIILLAAFWVAILSLLALVMSKSYALQPVQSTWVPELRGIFKHQQRLGLFMSLALGLAVISIINGHKDIFFGKILKYKKCYLIFISFIVIFAFARLYIAFSIIAFILAYLLTKSHMSKYITIAAFLIALIYLYNVNAGGALIESYDNGDISLTGRFTIWARTIEQGLLKPILGFGFGVFNSPQLDYMWSQYYRPPHAHNSFIQAFFDGGWVGVSLLCILIYNHFLVSTKVFSKYQKINHTSYIFFLALICSFTGVTYGGKPSILYSIVFLFIATAKNKTLRKIKWS
jgi:O-antigen ligase